MFTEERKKEMRQVHDAAARLYDLGNEIRDEIAKIHPTVRDVTLSESSVSLDTKYHTIRYSIYTNGDLAFWKEPRMMCSETSLPETVEEFKELKAEIDQDKKLCRNVAEYVAKHWFPEKLLKEHQEWRKEYVESRSNDQ